MENLPFLQRSDDHPPDPSPSETEQETQWRPPAVQFADLPAGPFKNMSPITILLIGVIIGVLVVSMRPIVIQK
jgi:hypothetical protein